MIARLINFTLAVLLFPIGLLFNLNLYLIGFTYGYAKALGQGLKGTP